MNLPEEYKTQKHLLYELIGAGLVLIQLIIQLAQRYIRYDWLVDSLWILSAILLILPPLLKGNPSIKFPGWCTAPATSLLLSLYLFLYHLLAVVLSLRYVRATILLFLACTCLYGLSLFLRAKEEGIVLKELQWKNLLRYPHWPLTIALILCLLALFLPMTKINSLRSYYGMQYGYSAYSGWGYNSWGYNFYGTTVLIKGHMAYWGHFACLLLSFLLVFHTVKAAGNKLYARMDLVFKISVTVIFAWWLFGAKGYNALKGFGSILFIPGILLMAAAVYVPDKLGELVKKKGLVK